MHRRKLTRHYIIRSKSPFYLTWKYALDYERARGAEAVSELPRGLQQVMLTFRFMSDYYFDGLEGYLSNHSDYMTSRLSDEIRQLPGALRAMNGDKMAALVERAIECWDAVCQSEPQQAALALDEYQLQHRNWWNLVISEFASLNEECGTLQRAWYDSVEDYIRKHADEFRHVPRRFPGCS